MRSILFFAIIILFFSTPSFAQTRQKQVAAIRTTLPINLDGNISEEAWKLAAVVNGLVEMRPNFGKKEDVKNRSELYLLYDDNAVYFGGNLYETSRDIIATQLVGRDEVGTNDFIGIIFDTYQDKINGLGFYVSPLNEQFDVKYSIGGNGGEDMSWNTVYHTATAITDSGWSFEMQIPYSALRFSKGPLQDWNIQILRRRAKTGQQYSWSPVDPNKFGFINQSGTWTGIRDIKPPLRLSFSPYFSTYLTRNPAINNSWKTSVNGGMDVKYGITDGFTMDMTLIPDFGQVQSDNQVLNLSPFEVKFSENRSFFNEGTELFNKGNLFYSRRIGGQPLHYRNNYALQPGEKLVENPVQTRLINATKLSGRRKKKLGIGFFNAITKAQYATIEKSNKEEYQIQTDPLTNYNILVLDQGLKNNSRVTFINTNVWRSGKDYDANVSSVDWDLYDNNVDWNIWGQVAHSRLVGYEPLNKTRAGNMYMAFLGKFKGRFNFYVNRSFADDKYDPSDMGYFTNNNYVAHGIYASYKWVKPKSIYNNIFLNLNSNYSQRYLPRKYQDFRANLNANSQLKNLWVINVNADIRPKRNDFYEARVPGWMVKQPASWMKGFGISTNSAKKYAASMQVFHRSSAKYNASNLELNAENSYRFNNKLSVGLGHFMEFHNRNFGFAAISDNSDSIFMSLRKIRTVENVLNIKYSFTNKMGLTLRVRHYWSKVKYFDFMNLKPDGNTENIATINNNPDINVNLFNIDMNYSWQFAPGSFINLTWKTSSELYNQLVMQRYYRNLGKSIDTPSFNSLSLKVIYFLDWLSVKNKNKKTV